MELTITKMTPRKAKTFLAGNSGNRNLRKRVVNQYARDMEAGRWTEQGDPIRVNCDGSLLDGQHRLEAIVKSGATIKMVVATGVDKHAMLNMDTGSKRSFADNLKIAGYKNVTNLAAAIRFGAIYDDDCSSPYRYDGTLSNAELLDWFERNPSIVDSVNVIAAMSHAPITGIKRTLIMLRFYADHLPDFDLFLHHIIRGENLSAGDPCLALFRYVGNSKIGSTRPLPEVMSAVTIKAWNAYITGQPINLLAHKVGGSSPEKFPTIITST